MLSGEIALKNNHYYLLLHIQVSQNAMNQAPFAKNLGVFPNFNLTMEQQVQGALSFL